MSTYDQQIAKLRRQRNKELEEASEKIEDALIADHQHTHNLVTLILQRVSKTHGDKYADKLVDKHELNEIFGIEKQA